MQCVAGKRADDFSGLSVDDWNIGEYLGKNKYDCTCSKCGFKREILGYYIKKNQAPKCTSCTAKQRDISGTNKGDWYVIKKVSSGRQAKYLCRCSCGLEREVLEQSLLNGKSTGCGHATNKKFIDMAGKTIGEWDVLEYNTKTLKWKCRCSCGTERELTGYQLRNKLSLSCGHSTTGFKDLEGKKFGEWEVLSRSGTASNNRTLWVCECSCGAIQDVDGYALTSGKSKSCGCKQNDYREKTSLQKYGVKHPAQLKSTIERTKKQLAMVENREMLLATIKSNFKEKPSIYELSMVLGISRGSTKSQLAKYGLEEYVVYGTQNTSGYEKWLDKLFPCEHKADRNLLNGKEIDLYYPERRFAIEFNGNYWHSELKKPQTYHQEKAIACREKDVQLFSIFEYEWNNSKTRDKMIEIIRNKLYGDRMNVVYARKCILKEIDNKESGEFMDRYHLQSRATAQIHIGLYYSNELVGVMALGEPRFNRKFTYEIVRIAWKNGVAVVGGTEKMFKYFLTKYNPDSIVSYCDISKFSGEVYERLGFKLDGISKPNYKWVNVETNEAIPRYKTMKSNLVKKGLGNESETEVEIMYRLGYIRVFDCGNARYIWNSED